MPDFIELVAALHPQPIAEGADLPQWLLEIVGSDVGKLLQLPVGSLQLAGVARLLLFGLLSLADVADEEGQHRAPSLAHDDHGHLGVENLAVGADRRYLDPPAQHRSFARIQITIDAVLLSDAHARRKKHVRGLGAQHLLSRVAEDLFRRLVELRDDSLVVDR